MEVELTAPMQAQAEDYSSTPGQLVSMGKGADETIDEGVGDAEKIEDGFPHLFRGIFLPRLFNDWDATGVDVTVLTEVMVYSVVVSVSYA